MKKLNIDNLIFENSNIDIFVNNIIETNQDIFKYPTINFEYNKDKETVIPEFRELIIELNKLVREIDGNIIPIDFVAEDYKKLILNETIDNAYRLGLENFLEN